MNECPCCKKLAISTWKKVNATKAFPVKCPECNELSFLPSWWHIGSVLSMEIVLWGSIIIIAIVLKSWFALLIFPVTIAFFYLMSKKVSLVPVTAAQVKSERKLMFMVFLAITLSVFIYQVFVR